VKQNMRKILALLIATAMVCALSPIIGADSTDNIVVTLTPAGQADIKVTPGTWNGESAQLGQTQKSLGDAFNLTNEGKVQVDVVVNATIVGDWTLVDNQNQTIDTVNLQYSLNNFVDNTSILDQAGAAFVSDFPPSAGGQNYTTFGLQVYMPEYSSTNDDQVITILFTATPCQT
jgi:hypothetical protein